LNSSPIISCVTDADEERATPAVLDHAREELPVVGRAQVNRTIHHAQRKIIIDRKRSRARAATSPRGQCVLAHRAPAFRFVGERLGAQHDQRQARAGIDPVGQPASAFELDHELDGAVLVGQQGVGAHAVRQAGVDGHGANTFIERPPRLLTTDFAPPEQERRGSVAIQPGPNHSLERALGRRHCG
jgi:hypothetical protein